ncbi:unnamed protein product [Urochloa humidicola]
MSDDKVTRKAPSSIRTIVVSNLESCMDEHFLYKCFATTGEVTGILFERDETTNTPNTAFVEFSTHAYAKKAKDYTNGKPRPDFKGFLFLEMRWADTNLDRTPKGPHIVTYKSDESPHIVTYKSDESSDSDTVSTLEHEGSDSD